VKPPTVNNVEIHVRNGECNPNRPNGAVSCTQAVAFLYMRTIVEMDVTVRIFLRKFFSPPFFREFISINNQFLLLFPPLLTELTLLLLLEVIKLHYQVLL
jgi:hypothetical protein